MLSHGVDYFKGAWHVTEGDSDPGETTDVSAAHPEVVQRLRVAAEAFEKELAANSRPIGRLD